MEQLSGCDNGSEQLSGYDTGFSDKRSEISETTRTAIAVRMVGKQCVGCSCELFVALVAF